MEYSEIIKQFNPKAKITYGAYNGFKLQLMKYKSFIDTGKKKDTDKEVDTSKINPEVVELSQKYINESNIVINNIHVELIKLFFSINDEIINNLELEEVSNLTAMITEARGDLINFFLTTK